MNQPKNTPSGKVVVYERATGKRYERWPVDARELLGFTKDGEKLYTLDADDCKVAAEPDPEPEDPDMGIKGEKLDGFTHPLGVATRAAASGSTPAAAPLQAPTRSSGPPLPRA